MLSAAKHLYCAVIQLVAARPRCFGALSMTCFWVGTAYAQQPEHRVYTYVEQMPELPGGGGTAAVVLEIQKRIHYPAIDTRKSMRYSGIKFIFVVDSTGIARDAAMVVSSDNLLVDQAILEAVRSLPKFSPGRQAGQPVFVRFTIPINCLLVR